MVKANNGSDKEWRAGVCRRCEGRLARARRHGGKPLPLDVEMPDDAQCAICGSSDDLVLDHCHESGKFRGVLCQMCNLTLGYAKDDPELLRNLAVYLEE